MQPKGHHNRGYLPHRDYGDSLQGITFREVDSIPKKVITTWKNELQCLLESSDSQIKTKAQQELRRRISKYEDQGYGKCLLHQPTVAQLVQDSLLSNHEKDYRLLAWCIMPNHVHVLIRQFKTQSLSKIIQSWKGGSARLINQALKQSGTIWEKDYYDRAIRNDDHFWNAITYIHQNPVKAGLVKKPQDWQFSSAGQNWETEREL